MLSQATRITRLLRIGAAAFVLQSGCAVNSARDASEAEVPSSAGAGTHAPTRTNQARTLGEAAAIVAVRQVGIPYRYGGNDAAGFDCSGLVQFSYARVGKRIPRTTTTLWRTIRPVADDELRAGDLLFFKISGKMSHVGLYIGSRRFVHAPSTGREVTIADLDSDFYRHAFLRAGRPY